MLKVIGLKNLEELFQQIPSSLRTKEGLKLPEGIPESELELKLARLAQKNKPCSELVCFAGSGVYNHYVPKAVDYLLLRSEFSTAYTPYQPEISQGTLQAIFEFQTMICELTGMEVANASMYDGGEASAEAVLMALRLSDKEKGSILISSALHPHYQRVIDSYTRHLEYQKRVIPITSQGQMDLDALRKIDDGICLVVQHPNYFGALEQMEEISKMVQDKDLILIVVICEALSLAILEPPGKFGAGMVVGEAQSFGIHPSFGGPLLGFFASKMEWVRKMPGRIVGETKDQDGRRGYVLTLATREQHIRRAKATSNICTNHSLMALSASIYLSLLGKLGLWNLARINLERAVYLRKKIEQSKFLKLKYPAPVFNEMVIKLGIDSDKAIAELAKQGILAGVSLKHHYPELADCLLTAVTELTKEKEIDQLIEKLEELVRREK